VIHTPLVETSFKVDEASVWLLNKVLLLLLLLLHNVYYIGARNMERLPFLGGGLCSKKITNSSLKWINLTLSGQTILGFMHPSDPTRTKIPSFESPYEILLTDAKLITKQHYSSDLWPLKMKRNSCIVLTNRSKLLFN
jgi:hypothetical protein